MDIAYQHNIFYYLLESTLIPKELAMLIVEYSNLPVHGRLPQWSGCTVYAGVNSRQAKSILNISYPYGYGGEGKINIQLREMLWHKYGLDISGPVETLLGTRNGRGFFVDTDENICCFCDTDQYEHGLRWLSFCRTIDNPHVTMDFI